MASRRPQNLHIQATGAHTLLVKWDHPRLPCKHVVEFTEGQVLWGNPFETVIGEGVSSFHLWDWNQTNRNGGDAPQELLKPNTKHRVRLCALHPESGLRSHWSDYTEASTSPAIPAEFTPTRTTPCELQQTFDAAEQELRSARSTEEMQAALARLSRWTFAALETESRWPTNGVLDVESQKQCPPCLIVAPESPHAARIVEDILWGAFERNENIDPNAVYELASRLLRDLQRRVRLIATCQRIPLRATLTATFCR